MLAKLIAGFFALLLLVYAGISALLYFKQRNLIFLLPFKEVSRQ